MRRILLPLALFLALTIHAHAEAIDDFVLTGGGNSYAFSLPATTTFESHPHIVYLGYTAPGTVNGVGGYTFYATFFYPAYSFVGSAQIGYTPSSASSIGYPLYGASPASAVYNPPDPASPNPYGTLTNTFQLGTFDLFTFDFNIGVRTPYTLTVTPEISTTPEPSTLDLVFTRKGRTELLSAINREILSLAGMCSGRRCRT